MKVFITGAGGYIGNSVVRAFHRAGHTIYTLDRNELDSHFKARFVQKHFAIHSKDILKHAEEIGACDAIIHLSAASAEGKWADIDRAAIDDFLSLMKNSNSRRILVYTTGTAILGGNRPENPILTERTVLTVPSPHVAWRPLHEQIVLDANCGLITTSVVRPSKVFGAKGGIIGGFFEAALKTGCPIVVGDGMSRWPTVHVEDLADLYLRVVEKSDQIRSCPATERVFNGVDGTFERVIDIARAASVAAGKGGEVKSVTLEEARSLIGDFANALVLDQVVETVNAEKIGWRPRYKGFVRNAFEMYSEWSKQKMEWDSISSRQNWNQTHLLWGFTSEAARSA